MSRILLGAVLIGAVALAGTACKGGDKDKKEPKPAAKPAADKKQPPAPPKDLTQEERVAYFQNCWNLFNAKDAAKFSQCYTETATSAMMDGPMEANTRDELMANIIQSNWTAFPDGKGAPVLTLVSGNRVFSVEHFTGTNTGEMMGMPATGKKVGYLFLHDFTMSGPGPVERMDGYIDMATIMGQLGVSPAPHRPVMEAAPEATVVIAKDDETEKSNLELAKKALEAFNSHDVKAVTALYADDVVFADQTMPADIKGKKEFTKALNGFYKAFPDIKAESTHMLAAGDYVVATNVMTGTNKGAMPEMGLKKPTNKSIEVHGAEIMKFQDGKIVEHWLFGNGMAWAIQLGLMPDPAAAKAEAGDEEAGDEDEGGDEQ